MAKLIQVFLNADLRAGHTGLTDLAKKHKLNPEDLEVGEYIVFINTAKDKLKMYASSDVIAYLKLQKGRKIDLRTIGHLPEVFDGKKINYNKALERVINQKLASKDKDLHLGI